MTGVNVKSTDNSVTPEKPGYPSGYGGGLENRCLWTHGFEKLRRYA